MLLCCINAIICIYEYEMIGPFVLQEELRDNQCGIVFQNNKENKPQIDALNHIDHCFVETNPNRSMPFKFSIEFNSTECRD